MEYSMLRLLLLKYVESALSSGHKANGQVVGLSCPHLQLSSGDPSAKPAKEQTLEA